MDRRLPSSLTSSGYSSVQRRSGGLDKSSKLLPSSPEVLHSSSCVTTARNPQRRPTHLSPVAQTLTAHVEATGAADDNPVVHPIHYTVPTSPSYLSRSRELCGEPNSRAKNLPVQGSPRPDGNNGIFIDVPLTPRQGRQTSDDSPDCSVSRLPTSDQPKQKSSFSLTKLIPRHGRPKGSRPSSTLQPRYSSANSKPQRDNSFSENSSSSRPFFISSSSGNYTQKWPKPRLNPRAIGGLVAAVEDSEGIGMETIDRWTMHKWILLMSTILVFAYSFAGLVCAILTWFRGWEHADVMHVADSDILTLITVTTSILIFTSLVGMSGTLLNSRIFLAIYCLLLWAAFISLAAVGYTSYRRSAFSLDRKLNLAWSQWYNPTSRLIVQDSLRCCGYYNALHEATFSKRCFPRTTLPGCKSKLYQFERENLVMIWSAVLALVPIHITVIFASLLCSNHVSKTFGKGITPRQYRLDAEDVKFDAEDLFSKFKDVGIISRPALSRPSSNAIFREDKAEVRPLISTAE